MNTDDMKKQAAIAALDYIHPGDIVGVGSGSTVNHFIDALATIKSKIEGAIPSSKATAERLRAHNIAVLDLNFTGEIPVYIDGADEINSQLEMIKGGGGALTGEKIVASCAQKFICIADVTKKVDILGKFPVAIEVIPLARSYVAREIVKLGGTPVYRENFTSDYGNVILDVHNLGILSPRLLEETLNNIAGVVTNGIFAKNVADILLLATLTKVKILKRSIS